MEPRSAPLDPNPDLLSRSAALIGPAGCTGHQPSPISLTDASCCGLEFAINHNVYSTGIKELPMALTLL
jgi:hypothetical protein